MGFSHLPAGSVVAYPVRFCFENVMFRIVYIVDAKAKINNYILKVHITYNLFTRI